MKVIYTPAEIAAMSELTKTFTKEGLKNWVPDMEEAAVSAASEGSAEGLKSGFKLTEDGSYVVEVDQEFIVEYMMIVKRNASFLVGVAHRLYKVAQVAKEAAAVFKGLFTLEDKARFTIIKDELTSLGEKFIKTKE